MKLLTKIFLAVVATGFTSCNDYLEVDPVGTIEFDANFTSVEGAITALDGAYQPLLTSGGYDESLWVIGDLVSDDAFPPRAQELIDFKNLNILATNEFLDELWEQHYRGILRANAVIARVPDITFPEGRTQLQAYVVGQAYFLRALYYFNLVRIFGEVPLRTEEIKTFDETLIDASSVEAIYEQIEQDLLAAISRLPLTYNGSRGQEVGRATQGAARALLAKAYLTNENWEAVLEQTSAVIDSGVYQLYSASNYGQNFQGNNENGQESIFEVQFSNALSSTAAYHSTAFTARNFSPGGAEDLAVTSDSVPISNANGTGIAEAYEEGDIRREAAIFAFKDGLYIRKYLAGAAGAGGNSAINYPVLRYRDVLLMQAEALQELARSDEAATIINTLRTSVGLEPLSEDISSNPDALREAIRQERRLELAFESNRFFDLNRWGITEERLSQQGVDVAGSGLLTTNPITNKPQVLFPIPFRERSTNPEIGG